MSVQIEYFGHSCFRVSKNGYRVLFDPYADSSVPGMQLPDQLEAEEVLCSHAHEDHNAVEKVQIIRSSAFSPFKVTEMTVEHDDANGRKRGLNKIRILSTEGCRIAHFGDLGRILNVTEIQNLMNLDCIMIPCGGYFTIDADQVCSIVERIQPKLTILMHYRTSTSGYSLIESIDEVQKMIPSLSQLDQSSVAVDGETAGIIALKPVQCMK